MIARPVFTAFSENRGTRIGARLRGLYVNGDSAGAIEVLLGATSLQEIVDVLEAKQRVTAITRGQQCTTRFLRRSNEAEGVGRLCHNNGARRASGTSGVYRT